MACSNYPTSKQMDEVLSARMSGTAMHYDIRASFLQNDPSFPFIMEQAIRGPDGKVARDRNGRIAIPDYIDYRTHGIMEVKPIHKGETEEDVYYANQEQLDRYTEVYQDAWGFTPTIDLLCYPAD